ncbi:hypothetical protein NA57DRAFT_78308 [Rhizodiscina lignyota]|uniref:Glutamyl-tRNA amidotransferase complex subunit Gta3 domain-containing protein n=1 Tax=Rhizodiscina lignyota TaxID=1504668 RepID=A0A9P4IBK9_9PEZI|nr:hypothetical protein NA57DRAFT_78308 [Rhizodiscina lignyota]
MSRTSRLHVTFTQCRSSSGLSQEKLGALLSKPTWSVRSLLPPSNDSTNTTPQESSAPTTPEITSKQLHHLLRLSALPAPQDEAEEARMLQTLSSQLHFVRSIQSIDTTGVEPLRSLRDESERGDKERTLGMAEMQDALDQEEIVGNHHKRIRRRPRRIQDEGIKNAEDCDVLGSAKRKVGRFFVVEGAPREE